MSDKAKSDHFYCYNCGAPCAHADQLARAEQDAEDERTHLRHCLGQYSVAMGAKNAEIERLRYQVESLTDSVRSLSAGSGNWVNSILEAASRQVKTWPEWMRPKKP